MKKLIALISIIVISFLAFLYVYNHPKNYESVYEIDGIKITETFSKKDRIYSFNLLYDEKEYAFAIEHKYIPKRNLIKKINKIEEENQICLIPESKEISLYPICKQNDENISYHLLNEKIKKEIPSSFFPKYEEIKDKYKNINLHTLDDATYLIWNYKGFYSINNKEKTDYNLFSKDIYDISLATQINEYLFIPDYEQEHNFNRVYIINLKKKTKEIWELDKEISFDSYILGVNNKSIFLVDRKNEIEYELVPHKKKMRSVGTANKDGKVFKNGWENISLTKLIYNDETFTYPSSYLYEIDNKTLYATPYQTEEKIRLSNNEITQIVSAQNGTIYYLAKDVLYRYSFQSGETKIMDYFEWNFNHKNMIFVFEI